MEFNYEAFNAQQAYLFDLEQRHTARKLEELATQQRKRTKLMAEYQELKTAYMRVSNDRRLKLDTRVHRLNDIVEAMLNIEDIICL